MIGKSAIYNLKSWSSILENGYDDDNKKTLFDVPSTCAVIWWSNTMFLFTFREVLTIFIVMGSYLSGLLESTRVVYWVSEIFGFLKSDK